MSLLTIVQGAFGELNLTQPGVVVTATDLSTQQMLVLANKEGKEVSRRFDWEILQKEGTFTTLAAETQVASVRTTFPDFGRVVDSSMWNRTQSWRCYGPLRANEWQARKASAAQAGVRNYFRIRGDAILFNPTPRAGDTIYFEYISNKWCQSNTLVAQSAWALDSDTALIDEEIIRLGCVWRWLYAKGLDYAEAFRTYEMALADIFGSDGGNAPVDMTGGPDGWLDANIPEANWSL